MRVFVFVFWCVDKKERENLEILGKVSRSSEGKVGEQYMDKDGGFLEPSRRSSLTQARISRSREKLTI